MRTLSNFLSLSYTLPWILRALLKDFSSMRQSRQPRASMLVLTALSLISRLSLELSLLWSHSQRFLKAKDSQALPTSSSTLRQLSTKAQPLPLHRYHRGTLPAVKCSPSSPWVICSLLLDLSWTWVLLWGQRRLLQGSQCLCSPQCLLVSLLQRHRKALPHHWQPTPSPLWV